jgi:hypothetical protein
LEDRKCFYWWVQEHLKHFEVQSARKSPITVDEEIFLYQNYISHHWVHIPLSGCKI